MLACRRPCADHRTALLDFVDRRELTSATPAALAHLDRCADCERELASTVLTIAGLRRIRAQLSQVEPPADTWIRLRARVTRRADPWRWRATLGRLAAGALLVSVLLTPVTTNGPGAPDDGVEARGSSVAQSRELADLSNHRAGRLPPTRRVEPGAGSVPVYLPPEIAEVRKEVTPPPRPDPRTSKPI